MEDFKVNSWMTNTKTNRGSGSRPLAEQGVVGLHVP
jgi:hypothetical protein